MSGEIDGKAVCRGYGGDFGVGVRTRRHASAGGSPPPPPPFQEITGPIQDSTTIRTASLITDTFGDRWRVDEWTFDPYRTRVTAGTSVTFINNGDDTHTIEAVDGSWTTGPLQPNDQVALTFDKVGTFLFHRKEHPWSYGQIVVVDKSATTSNQSQPPRVPGGNRILRRRWKTEEAPTLKTARCATWPIWPERKPRRG